MELLLATGGWQLASCTSFNDDRISIYFYLFHYFSLRLATSNRIPEMPLLSV